MIYIFAIFFILELIVMVVFCHWILSLDKKVCEISERFKVNRHTLKFQLRSVYDTARTFKAWIVCQKREFEKKRKSFYRGLIKGILISLLLFVFKKTKLRNKILFVDLILILYDTLRADCKI